MENEEMKLGSNEKFYKKAVGFFETNTKVHFQKKDGIWGNGYIINVTSHFFVINEEKDGEMSIFYWELDENNGITLYTQKKEAKEEDGRRGHN